MSFFKVEKSSEAVRDSGLGAKFIGESGIYDVVIQTVEVRTNDKGARSLNFRVQYGAGYSTLYGLKLDMNNGEEHYQRREFNKLCVIAGLDDISEPTKEARMWFDAASKGDTMQELMVLTEFDDMPVKIKVKERYGRYNGKITKQLEIDNFYRAKDNATASEIINDKEFGKQYEKDLKYANAIKYSDGLTEEEVKAWKEKNNGQTASEPTKATKPVANPFAK